MQVSNRGVGHLHGVRNFRPLRVRSCIGLLGCGAVKPARFLRTLGLLGCLAGAEQSI
jgi:hypothetical protein